MALTRKETTQVKDTNTSSEQKEPSKTSVSYQEDRASTSKMGPVSSTVEGSK